LDNRELRRSHHFVLFLECRNRESTGKICLLIREEAETEQDVRKQRIRKTALIPYKDSSFE
jgi:hypothetical protein